MKIKKDISSNNENQGRYKFLMENQVEVVSS